MPATEGAGLPVSEAHHLVARAAQRRLAFRHLGEADPVFARLAEHHPDTDPFDWDGYGRTDHDLFRTLVFLIIGQAVTKDVATRQYDDLTELAGGPLTPAHVADLTMDDLARIGIPPFKATALTMVTDAISEDRLDLAALDELLDEQVCQVLTLLPGVGRWAVELFLIRGLHRPDVLPGSDPGLRRTVQREWNLPALPTSRDVDVMSGYWRPYRSFAAALLWASQRDSAASPT